MLTAARAFFNDDPLIHLDEMQAAAYYDFIVIGAGVAGLRAAIELAPAGKVLVIAKQELAESNTRYAQGGIAVALSDEDEVGLHLQDTIYAGDGLVDEAAAQVLVNEGPERIQELIRWGTEFDRDGTKLTFTREAAHSRSRILHAHGDSTGREIGRALAAKARTLPNISFAEHAFTTELLLDDNGDCCGVELLAGATTELIGARAVLLASGGAGQIYSDTTNPSVATGDGIAMAYRAGADISDLEFFQFHPTALSIPGAPRFLLSEALRGEGGVLLNSAHERFMHKYHEMAELAPRDVVARAITQELTIAASAGREVVCYLDLRHLEPEHVRARFPHIAQTCLAFGIHIARDLIPVRPAAHYLMGGVRTDLDARTSVPNLFAAGETACTGVHGANRLASNSLLEGLVFGARAGSAMQDCRRPESASGAPGETPSGVHPAEEIQKLMWNCAGVVRSQTSLKSALDALSQPLSETSVLLERSQYETRNLQQVALLLVRCALARKESRGAHYRTDFPQRDDARFRKHSVVSRKKDVLFL
ncbi:MAG TPA: L-aspartate oxidase [Terriglobales bacterium]|jgi:L-aspartate oxidase